MTRASATALASAALIELLLCAAGCHRVGPPAPTPTPISAPTPDTSSTPAARDHDPVDDTGGPRHSGIPAAVDASACEQSCAELYTCVIEAGNDGPAAASSIELGCLEACIPRPDHGSLFGCELPLASVAPARCPPFLACVREAWPKQGLNVAPPVVEHVGPGCERACWAFARCEAKDQTEDEIRGITKCIQKCGEALDDAQERRVGECSDLPACDALEACVLSLPGA